MIIEVHILPELNPPSITSQIVSLPLISAMTNDPGRIGLIHPAKIMIVPKIVFLSSIEMLSHGVFDIILRLEFT